MRRFTLFLAVLVLLTSPPRFCRAETISLCDAASSDDYLTKASGQFLRGASNIGFCWLEIIHQPIREVQGGGNLFLGLARGVGHSFLRVAQGVGDIATCASPHRDEEGNFPAVTQDCVFGSAGLEDR